MKKHRRRGLPKSRPKNKTRNRNSSKKMSTAQKNILSVGVSAIIGATVPPLAPLMVTKELLNLGAQAALGEDADKPGVKVVKKALSHGIHTGH